MNDSIIFPPGGSLSPASIQKVQVYFPGNSYQAVVSISPVDPAKTLVLLGPAVRVSGAQMQTPRCSALSATSVTVSFPSNIAAAANGTVTIIDFGSAVKGVQRGSLVGSASTVSINPVNPAKCAVFTSTALTQTAIGSTGTVTLTATQLTIGVGNTRDWQIVEFH